MDVSTLSIEDRAKYESYYKDALAKQAVTEATFTAQIALAPIATSNPGYRSGVNDIYDFDSSGTAAYKTATNILEVRNPNTNNLFIADVKTTVGDTYWNAVVIPVYEGTKAAVTAAVAQVITNGESTRPGVTADMQKFWDVGVANGNFPVTEAGIQKAVEAYSAALTLAVIEAPASNKVVAAGSADGLRGQTTTIAV